MPHYAGCYTYWLLLDEATKHAPYGIQMDKFKEAAEHRENCPDCYREAHLEQELFKGQVVVA